MRTSSGSALANEGSGAGRHYRGISGIDPLLRRHVTPPAEAPQAPRLLELSVPDTSDDSIRRSPHARLQFQRRPRGAARSRCCAQAADEMLDWHGSGMSVMEMSHRGKEFISIARRGRGRSARAAGDPGELQGAVPAGRRDRRERDRADEPAARQDDRRLRQHRRMVEEVDQGSEEVLHRSTSPRQREDERLHLRARARELEARPGRRLRAHLHQRDDRRRRIPLDARHRRRAAGGRHVVAHPVAPDRRVEVRR